MNNVVIFNINYFKQLVVNNLFKFRMIIISIYDIIKFTIKNKKYRNIIRKLF